MDHASSQNIASINPFALLATEPSARSSSERTGAKAIPTHARFPATPSSSTPNYDKSERQHAVSLNAMRHRSFAQAVSNLPGEKQQPVVTPEMFLDLVIKARHKPPEARLDGVLESAMNLSTDLSKADARILLAETILTLEDCWDGRDAAAVIDTLANRADYPALLKNTNEVKELTQPDIRRITVFTLLSSVENGPVRFNEHDIRISLDGLSKPLAISLANSAANAVLQNEIKQLRIDDIPKSLKSDLNKALRKLDGYGSMKQEDQSLIFSRARTAHFGAIPENPQAKKELLKHFGSNGNSATHPISFSKLTALVKSLPKNEILPSPDNIFWDNLANNLANNRGRNLRESSSPKNEPLGWIAILNHAHRRGISSRSFRLSDYSGPSRITNIVYALLQESPHISGNDVLAIVTAYKNVLPDSHVVGRYKDCIDRMPPRPGEMRISPQALGAIYESFRFASIANQVHIEAGSQADPNRDLRKVGLAGKLIPFVKKAHFDDVTDICNLITGLVGLNYSVVGELCEFILDRGLLDCSPNSVLTPAQLVSVARILQSLTPDMADKMAQLLLQHITAHGTSAWAAMRILEGSACLSQTRSEEMINALLPTIRKASGNNSASPSDNDILDSMKVLRSSSLEVAKELGEALFALIGRGDPNPVKYHAIAHALIGATRLPDKMQEELAPLLAAYLDKVTIAHARVIYHCVPVLRNTTINAKLFEVARSIIERAPLNDPQLIQRENLHLDVLLNFGQLCKDNPAILEITQKMIARMGYMEPSPSQLIDPEQVQALAIEALSATTYLQLEADLPCIDLHGLDVEFVPFILKHGIPQWKKMHSEELVIKPGIGKHNPQNVGKMKNMAEITLETMGIPKAAIQDTSKFKHPMAEIDKEHYTNTLLISRQIAWPSNVPQSGPGTPSIDKPKALPRTIIGKLPASGPKFNAFGAWSTTESLQAREIATKAREAKLAAAKAECMDAALENGFNWALMLRGVTLSSTDGKVLDGSILVNLHLAGSAALERLGKDRGDMTATLRSQNPYFALCEEKTGFPVRSIVAAIRYADSVDGLDSAIATFLSRVEQRQAGMVLRFASTSAGAPVKLAVHEVLKQRIAETQKGAHLKKYSANALPQFKASLHRIVEDYATFCFQMKMLKADSDAKIAAEVVNAMQTLVANDDDIALLTSIQNNVHVPLLKHSFKAGELDDKAFPGLLSAAFSEAPDEAMTTRDFEHDGKAYRLNCTFQFGQVATVHIEERYGEPRTLLQMQEQGESEVRFGVVLARSLVIKSPEVARSTLKKVVKGALNGIHDNRPSPIEFYMPIPLQSEHGKQAYSVEYQKSDDDVVTSLRIDEREFRTVYQGASVSAAQQVAALKDAGIDASQVRYMWPFNSENDNAPSGYAYITKEQFELVRNRSMEAADLLHQDTGDALTALNFNSGSMFGFSKLSGGRTFAWSFKPRTGSLIEISSLGNLDY